MSTPRGRSPREPLRAFLPAPSRTSDLARAGASPFSVAPPRTALAGGPGPCAGTVRWPPGGTSHGHPGRQARGRRSYSQCAYEPHHTAPGARCAVHPAALTLPPYSRTSRGHNVDTFWTHRERTRPISVGLNRGYSGACTPWPAPPGGFKSHRHRHCPDQGLREHPEPQVRGVFRCRGAPRCSASRKPDG